MIQSSLQANDHVLTNLVVPGTANPATFTGIVVLKELKADRRGMVLDISLVTSERRCGDQQQRKSKG